SHAPSPGWLAARYLFAHWKDYSAIMAKDVVKLLSGNSMKVAAWALLKDERYAPTAVPVHSTETPLAQARELMKRHPGLGAVLILYLLFLGLAYALAAWGTWTAVRLRGWQETGIA